MSSMLHPTYGLFFFFFFFGGGGGSVENNQQAEIKRMIWRRVFMFASVHIYVYNAGGGSPRKFLPYLISRFPPYL